MPVQGGESLSESARLYLQRLADSIRSGAFEGSFPRPPLEVRESYEPLFQPAPDLRDWALGQFVHENAPLQNPDHQHLQLASVLFVWSSVTFRSGGQVVVGTAQTGAQQGAKGKKELLEATYRTWNGGTLPDFVITVCAPYIVEADPVAICALIEHELYHCGQARDEFGFPKYTQDGLPKLTMRGHDIEIFHGEVMRYGAYDPRLERLKQELTALPEITRERAENAVCGCGAKV